MKKVLLLVEGFTEEAFVKRLLAPALPGLTLIPTVVKTRTTGARPHKGGFVKYAEFRRQLLLLLRDPTATLVSMMFDYQGLGADFPSRHAACGQTPKERVSGVEQALQADIGDPRFLPFLAMHEFEALLFVEPRVIAEVVRRPELAAPLQAIRQAHPATPEEINDSPATSPSARIEQACDQHCGSARVFQKLTHGLIAATRIGLPKMRAECPHFAAWLARQEAHAAA